MAQNNINIKLELEVKEAKEKIEALEKEIKALGDKESETNKNTKEFEKNLQNVNKKSQDLVKTLSNLALKIGLAFGAGEVIKNMAEFQASISKLGAISGATKTQMEELRQKAIDLGGSSVYSSGQVAEAMNYLAMAGFKTNQILASTKDVLNLATIGQMDLARASDIASNILTGFGINADKTNEVVDVMTATITNANTDISQLGEAMKYVAPQAKAMGISIQDTSTAIGILSNAGIQGTMAGTGLAGMLTRLANPTGQAGKIIKNLGIQVYDTNGKFVGLKNVLMQFNEKLKGLTNEQRIKALSTIFGQEHLKSAIVLINSMSGAYQGLLDKIDKSAGLSDKIAKKMQDNLLGAWKGLLSSLDKLEQTIGHDLLPLLTSMVKELTNVVNAGTEFYKNNKALIQTLGELAITIYGFTKLRAILLGVIGSDVALNMATMTAGVTKLKEAFIALKTAIMGISKATLALGGLTIAITGVIYALNDMEDELDKYNQLLDKSIQNNKDMRRTYDEISSHMQRRGQITATADELKNMTDKIKNNLKNTEELIKQFKEKINDYSWYDKMQDKIFGVDRLRDYKNQLQVLEDKHKTLEETLKKIEKTKPYEAKNLNAGEYKKTLVTLTQAQQKYLKSLDDQLRKATQINSTQKQGMQDEINRARQILGLTTQFEEAKEKIKKIYALKKIENFKKEYQTRIREHTNTINKLEAKEKSLTDKIVQLQTQLNEKLKNIENQRILAIGNIEDRIKNLQMSGASEYQKYVMIKERADKKYALAKQALEQGNFQLAKSYMSQYSSLISQISNKEIKENGRVVVTKKQANAVAISNLRRLEGLTNAYYAKERQEAINSYNNKIRLIKAQLEATKEQIKLEVQRLNLEKQMIQIMTGKKVTIDTSGALKEIKSLDNQIKSLDNQIKHPKKIKITADTNQAKQKVNAEVKQFENKKIQAKITADTNQAKQKVNAIFKITDELTGKEKVIKYTSNGEKVKNDIKPVLEITDKVTGKIKKITLTSNADETKNKINGVLKITDEVTGKEKVVKFKADGSQVEKEINTIKKPTESKHSVKLPNFNQVENKINSLNNKNTSSTHTIYIKEVHTKATGGIIPLRRATGGEIDFKRQEGKIPGYDPHDSDDVPALLTRGEFVIKRDAVSHYGENFLYALNNKTLPKFATGGIVRRGHPQVITKDIQSTLNDLGNNTPTNTNNGLNGLNTSNLSGLNIDLSKLDDLINQLEELSKTLKAGGATKEANLAKNLIKSINSEKNKLNTNIKKEKNDISELSKFQNSIIGKVLTQEQRKSYENELASKSSKVKSDDNHLLKLDKQKKEFIKKIEKEIEKINQYLKEVEDVKSKISDKLSSFGIDLSSKKEINDSLDLDRLKKYLKNISKFDVNKTINAEKEKIRQNISVLEMSLKDVGALKYADLGSVYDRETWDKEAQEINTLKSKLNNNDELKKEALEAIKKALPKFQKGGLLQLQNGGKLSGYGGGDRNLALLEDGEFVIRKEAVSHFGADYFDKLNNIKLPKFQNGGLFNGNYKSTETKRDVIDLNLNLGNKSFKLQSERSVADDLVRELKKIM